MVEGSLPVADSSRSTAITIPQTVLALAAFAATGKATTGSIGRDKLGAWRACVCRAVKGCFLALEVPLGLAVTLLTGGAADVSPWAITALGATAAAAKAATGAEGF